MPEAIVRRVVKLLRCWRGFYRLALCTELFVRVMAQPPVLLLGSDPECWSPQVHVVPAYLIMAGKLAGEVGVLPPALLASVFGVRSF